MYMRLVHPCRRVDNPAHPIKEYHTPLSISFFLRGVLISLEKFSREELLDIKYFLLYILYLYFFDLLRVVGFLWVSVVSALPFSSTAKSVIITGKRNKTE